MVEHTALLYRAVAAVNKAVAAPGLITGVCCGRCALVAMADVCASRTYVAAAL
jgi:hypothetical protein